MAVDRVTLPGIARQAAVVVGVMLWDLLPPTIWKIPRRSLSVAAGLADPEGLIPRVRSALLAIPSVLTTARVWFLWHLLGDRAGQVLPPGAAEAEAEAAVLGPARMARQRRVLPLAWAADRSRETLGRVTPPATVAAAWARGAAMVKRARLKRRAPSAEMPRTAAEAEAARELMGA